MGFRSVVLALVLSTGCASFGGVTDGTSVSWGAGNRGRLLGAVELPAVGDGYAMPALWHQRGLKYGTDELVGIIVRATRRVLREHPGSRLYVGDLSLPAGGHNEHHRSHQSGRDVDIMFYGVMGDGRPMPTPTSMPNYGSDGVCQAQGPAGLRFDVVRNWALVRALLEDPVAEVQFIFVHDDLKHLLLAYAAEANEPMDLILEAAAVMQQPGDSAPHDDHFHVRIFCSPDDEILGCRDRGPVRWLKKSAKYTHAVVPGIPTALLAVVDSLAQRTVPSVLLALR